MRLLEPLRSRDFTLLWTAQSVSLIGDGVFLIAIAWHIFDLSNSPTALAVVGGAWAMSFVAFLLIGGVVADRLDRRALIVTSDVIRGLALVSRLAHDHRRHSPAARRRRRHGVRRGGCPLVVPAVRDPERGSPRDARLAADGRGVVDRSQYPTGHGPRSLP